MSKISLSIVLDQVRGEVTDPIFQPGGKETATVGEVVLYGRVVIADPDLRVLYRKADEDRGYRVFNLMLADCSNALAIEEVDLSSYAGAAGDQILVHLSEGRVPSTESVRVALTDVSGDAIERGEARPADNGAWVYTTTEKVDVGTTVRIAVNIKTEGTRSK